MQSSSSSFSKKFTYQVFLSFRGIDTRYGFTGNLYNALTKNGIHTFIDDEELHRGDEIKPSLENAIEESRIIIIVFSANYASSSFCLDELVRIIHCYRANGRLVLPIFYGVNPTDVRKHSGSYGVALAEHEKGFQSNKDNMKKLQNWKTALTQAANLSGDHWCTPTGYEYKFIDEIVKYISNKIKRVPLHVANYPVGIEFRVFQVQLLIEKGSSDGVHFVGIHGTGGLGKSTLARAIYNFFADQFECLCFLHKVRESSLKNDLKHLQEELLLQTIGLEIKLRDASEGITTIKERLCRKKILLILDDVDNIKQLHDLAGGDDWFGPGTRIIITTRDKHLLTKHGIESTYPMKGLYGEEALALLTLIAFKSNKVPSGYEDVLDRAVTYASGLPLAIETVGSNLFEKSIEEWKNTLEGYEKIPNEEIQNILRVSYDALEEEQQSVFLDIACCFKGCRWEEFENILHVHYGHCIKHHVEVLATKSLINIDIRNQLGSIVYVTLHNLIEDMGKEVVRQESPKEPGERSRLWCHEDIVHVLQEYTGASKVEMIYLNYPSMEAVIKWKGNAFKKMKKLNTLIIQNGDFSKSPMYLPSSLRVLKWKGYPSESLSSTVFLNKEFKNMKILILNDCEYLTKISDLSCLPNLEKISFENCKNLVTIHDSIGFLSQLQILNATGCEKLLRFPSLKLISLQDLKLSGCKCLKKFPEILDKMKNIKEIIWINTGIKELPFSFQNLSELACLLISGHGKLKLPSSILKMSNLLEVIIYGYSELLPKPNSSMLSSKVKSIFLKPSNHEFIIVALTWFSNVESLSLKGSNIKILPKCLGKCHFLERIDLDDCAHLEEICGIPPNLKNLSLKGSSIKILPKCLEKCPFLESIDLDDCEYLEEISGIPPNLKKLSAIGCKSLTSSSKSVLMSQKLHEAGGTEFYFPSSVSHRIPEWFEHQRRQPSISFSFRNNFPSLVFFFSSKRMHELVRKKRDPEDVIVYLVINDHVYALFHSHLHSRFKRDYTYLLSFDGQYWSRYISKIWSLSIIDVINSNPNLVYNPYSRDFESKKDRELLKSMLHESQLKNEWIHAEVCFGFGGEYACWDDEDVVESGIHVIEHLTNMDDFQFTDYYVPDILKQSLTPSPTPLCSIM